MAVPARSKSFKPRNPNPMAGRYTGKGRTLIGIVMTHGKLVIAGAEC
jgi:hypothetical protein